MGTAEMAWQWHLFWGAVVYLAALQLGRGVAAAGEWVGKAVLTRDEAVLALQREALLRGRPGART